MTELDERLARLDSLIGTIERGQLEQTVSELEQRVRELEAERASPRPVTRPRAEPSRDTAPPPGVWAGFGSAAKTTLAGLLALIVPVSTLIYGLMERNREQLSTEHEIVKTHLKDVLAGDPADAYDLTHLRHLRFLRKLAPDEGDWGSGDLKSILGDWAEDEYQLKLRQISGLSIRLAEDINDERVEIELLEQKLRVDRGWYEQEYRRWTKTSATVGEEIDPQIRVLTGKITRRFEARDAKIEVLSARLRDHEDDWATLQIALEGAGKGQLLDPLEYLARGCEAKRVHAGTEDKLSRSTRLTRCTQAGRLSYGRALELGTEHASYDSLVEIANDYFERACNEGWGKACRYLADSYRLKHVRTPEREAELVPEYAKELSLFERARELGDPSADNSLGWYYLEAEGVEKNPETAKRLFSTSCELGVLNGCDSLGTWHARAATAAETDTSKRDQHRAQAIEHFEAACGGGEIRACVNHINLLRNLPPSDFETPSPAPDTVNDDGLANDNEDRDADDPPNEAAKVEDEG